MLHDADRMNAAAANILLKTLEEPPANTTLLLLTARPMRFCPRSGAACSISGFRGCPPRSPPRAGRPGSRTTARGSSAWARAWRRAAPRPRASSGLYGLVARFGAMLDKASALETARRKALLPEGLDDEELAAIEVEISVGLRTADVRRH